MMGLWEFLEYRQPPDCPIRKKDDVHQIVARWEDSWGNLDGSGIDYTALEEDIHALAHIAMQHLPD